MIVEETEEWEVDRMLDSRGRYRNLRFLIQWAGYNHIPTSWEAAEYNEIDRKVVDICHRAHLDRPHV
jgi:hypothetical protein